MYQALFVEPQSLSVPLLNWLVHKSLSLFLSLCLGCSCLDDRVRGVRPGQWQSETGGELALDTLHVFTTFRLFSSRWVWYIHSPACGYWDASLYSAWQWKSNLWMEVRREEARIAPLNDMLEWRRRLSRSLLINTRGEDIWCHQKVPGGSLQREQCKGGHYAPPQTWAVNGDNLPPPSVFLDLTVKIPSSSLWLAFPAFFPPLLCTYTDTHAQADRQRKHRLPLSLSPPLFSFQYHIPFRLPPSLSFTNKQGQFHSLSPLPSITG